MNFFQRFFGHLHTINRHKRLVMKGCIRLGLYKQALLHDLSKYSPTEFFVGVKYYQGYRSPNFAEKEANDGISLAWLHHKGRNKHHIEYWIDYDTDLSHKNATMIGMKMPARYVAEMFCDRLAASKNYKGKDYKPSDPWDYYKKVGSHYIIHPDTKAMLEKLLLMVRDEGEDAAFDYVKNVLLVKGY